MNNLVLLVLIKNGALYICIYKYVYIYSWIKLPKNVFFCFLAVAMQRRDDGDDDDDDSAGCFEMKLRIVENLIVFQHHHLLYNLTAV